MALDKVISYSSATLNPSGDLEKFDSDTRVRLKPRDENGNHVVALAHLNLTNSDTTNKIIDRYPEEAYNEEFLNNRVQWDNTVKKFGAASAYLRDVFANIRLPYNSRYNNLSEFSADAFVRFTTLAGSYERLLNEFYFLDSSNRGRWLLDRLGTELRFVSHNASGAQHILSTSGLGLSIDTWYHIRCSYEAGEDNGSEAKISVDGSQVADTMSAKLLATLDESLCPCLTIGAVSDHSSRRYYYGDTFYCDEFIFYPSVLPSNFSVRDSALKPFSQNEPRTTLTLDTEFNYAVWDASSIGFLDETVFTNNGIKLRWDSDNDDTPSFSGDPMTLTQFKAGDDPIGRYLHLEFTFYSDGDTQRILPPGLINVRASKPSVIARRKPEIVRR